MLKQMEVDGQAIEKLKRAFAYKLFFQQGSLPISASLNDYYLAVSCTLRDRMQALFINTVAAMAEKKSRIVCYLSAEFLMGPHLLNNLINLGLYDAFARATRETGLDLQQIIEHEEEPGLGNGGLGRLAACYLDSMATLEIPAIGYGIRYEFGMFDQTFEQGWQKELSDRWLLPGNPWEFKKSDLAVEVGFGGQTATFTDQEGRVHVCWTPGSVVKGIPYDTPVPGYRVNTVNMLRLWSAEAPKSFDFDDFNVGDYFGSVEEKIQAENITKVLYPNDQPFQGKVLRLRQQYFFASASLQDMIRLHRMQYGDLDGFHQHFAIQLNDTHPAIAVPELMRLLVDVHGYAWDQAWAITSMTFAYTNHTLLPEALETWSVDLLGQLLPRHLEIILEINRRFLDTVRSQYPGDEDLIRRVSIIDENGERCVRMAHLACIGSHKINGVAALHTELLKQHTLADFHRLWPEKLVNVTNGVTPRRWMALSNPGLTELIASAIGEQWLTDLDRLRELEPLANGPAFRERWRAIKHDNKIRLARILRERTGIVLDPASLFDIQVKRIHEYKRQHLNLLHIITLYNRLKRDPGLDLTPRSFIFGGKAAPGYFMAKLIIKLINSVAEAVNNDPDVDGRLRVAFFPDFNVKNAHAIYPAADLSEQISTAGKEASGTGNMKFAMNGALTIGTLDGANVEIRDQVGAENFFLFGMRVDEVEALWAAGYRPRSIYEANEELRAAIDLIADGRFSGGDRHMFRPLIDSLLEHDPFLVLADYQAYLDCQQQVGAMFRNQEQWCRMSILNVSRMGLFSSDRSIAEYCEKIWQVRRSPVALKWERLPSQGIVFPKRPAAPRF
ncbi:glycogen/starch/alpha-glucan phosphorylase [Desulfobulbus sp.]|uniref:glycogen/starch/alpha-glucan phosphorylase n=1 Tax=Desulfobulbus sp. TaxID=895 RepID=UPI00286EF0EE|nr:glycogen/starch/alpha-glucan phosphorylase [Desulfobulbus sp.]